MRKRSSIKQAHSKDENVLAKSMVDSIINEIESETLIQKEGKNPAAVSLGRLGGLKGGKARAKMLSADKRSEIARKAANARWKKP